MSSQLNHAPFPLVLISAWNDSGGAFTHRLFDGHPAFFCYPFELQLGTGLNKDAFSTWFMDKYRWPEFSKPIECLESAEIFASIIDQELKSTLASPGSGKFKSFVLDAELLDWQTRFDQICSKGVKTRRAVVINYLTSFFNVWRDRVCSNEELMYIGHCPVIMVDWEKIVADFPEVKIIHVVRSPLTGFVDMRYRRPEVDLRSYCQKWSVVNSIALVAQMKSPQQVKVIRFDDLLFRREGVMVDLCHWLTVDFNTRLLSPSWNTRALNRLYPFGGVRDVSIAHETHCLDQLTEPEKRDIQRRTFAVADLFDQQCYQNAEVAYC